MDPIAIATAANAASKMLTGNSLLGWLGKLLHLKAVKAQIELPAEGMGPTRTEQVIGEVMAICQGAVASGIIDAMPADSKVRELLQAIVAAGKLTGTIPPSVPATSAQNALIPVGTILRVQVIP